MSKKIRTYLAELPPLLLFLILPVLSFPELFSGQTLYRNDITLIHYPLRYLAAEQWLSGQVPLWNPYAFMGFPFLAEGQVGILYPLNLLFWLPIPTHLALTLFISLHYFLAATFTYILGRSVGLSRTAATVSGLAFGFGGFFMGQVTNLNIMSGSVWLPLIFAALLYTLKTNRWSVAIISGLPLALQSLTSQPQMILYTMLLLGGYVAFQTVWLLITNIKNQDSISPTLPPILKSWALLSLLVGSGLIIAAPQLLSSWELTQHSIRSGGLTVEQMGQYSLPPMAWFNLLLPGLFGNMVRPYAGVASNMSEAYVYVGILPLVFACFSWRLRRQKLIIFLWLVIIVCGLLAMGRFTPFLPWLQLIPIINLFRGFGRWSLMVMLALALLAGFGVDLLLKQSLRRSVAWVWTGVWLTLTTLLVLMALFPDWFLNLSTILTREMGIRRSFNLLVQTSLLGPTAYFDNRLILGPLSWWLTPTVALITRLGATVALLLGYAYHTLSRRAFSIAIITLTALDMVISGGTAINPITPADFWEQQSDAVAYILEHQNRLNDRVLYRGPQYPDEAVSGGGTYFSAVYQILSAEGYGTPIRISRFDIFRDALDTNPLRALSLTATRFVITPESFGVSPFLNLLYEGESWYVYENPYALPRAFIVHQASIARDPNEALGLIRQPDFDPRQAVVLEAIDALPPLPPATPDTPGQATVIQDSGGRVDIQANLAAPGFLVLLDTYYPGWQATVDGQPVEIWPANYFTRAVYLEAGEHTISFVYRPLSFWSGLGLMALGLLGVGGAAWWLWRESRSNE